jgi:hypothetical protein
LRRPKKLKTPLQDFKTIIKMSQQSPRLPLQPSNELIALNELMNLSRQSMAPIPITSTAPADPATIPKAEPFFPPTPTPPLSVAMSIVTSGNTSTSGTATTSEATTAFNSSSALDKEMKQAFSPMSPLPSTPMFPATTPLLSQPPRTPITSVIGLPLEHSSPLKYQCTQLNIRQKFEVLQQIDQRVPYREIAKSFNIAQSTITGIKKNREEIVSLMNAEHGVNLHMHRIHKSMSQQSKVLDDRIYEWFIANKINLITVTGKQIQEKALEIAQELLIEDFKASNGWLDAFKRRHNIVLKPRF